MRDENYLQIPGHTQNKDFFSRAVDIAGECVLLFIFLTASNFANEGVRTDGWILPEAFHLSYILLLIVLDLCMLCC